MKKVSYSEWETKADNFQRRISIAPYKMNLEHYKKVLSYVDLGSTVLDVGCGDRHLEKVLPDHIIYYGIDPYPRDERTQPLRAEELTTLAIRKFDSVFMLAALDNTQNVTEALEGMKEVAIKNIVILTGIGVKPDMFHTHEITRDDLVSVLGEPITEVKWSEMVYLFVFNA